MSEIIPSFCPLQCHVSVCVHYMGVVCPVASMKCRSHLPAPAIVDLPYDSTWRWSLLNVWSPRTSVHWQHHVWDYSLTSLYQTWVDWGSVGSTIFINDDPVSSSLDSAFSPIAPPCPRRKLRHSWYMYCLCNPKDGHMLTIGYQGLELWWTPKMLN